MRLICPNCDAQYEVDESVIPAEGRDVQCSNCGHTWFQQGAGAADLAASDEPDAGPDGTFADSEAEPGDAEPPAELDLDEPVPPSAAPPPPAPPPAPADMPDRRQTLDEAVLSVLREEAERETRARRAEGLIPIETQPDLGLPAGAGVAAPIAPPVSAEERVAHIDAPDEEDAEDAAARAPRRDLLPDIEEINSTLSATSVRTGDDELPVTQEVIAQRRNGFRRGFSIALMLMVLLLAVYVLAPNIATRFPATEPWLRTYVGQIDTFRLWLDERMKSSTEALRGGDGAATE